MHPITLKFNLWHTGEFETMHSAYLHAESSLSTESALYICSTHVYNYMASLVAYMYTILLH